MGLLAAILDQFFNYAMGNVAEVCIRKPVVEVGVFLLDVDLDFLPDAADGRPAAYVLLFHPLLLYNGVFLLLYNGVFYQMLVAGVSPWANCSSVTVQDLSPPPVGL